MDLIAYNDLVNFISSNHEQFPEKLENGSTKSERNKRHHFKKTAEKYFIKGKKTHNTKIQLFISQFEVDLWSNKYRVKLKPITTFHPYVLQILGLHLLNLSTILRFLL